MDIKRLMEEAESIDYTAVIARLAGRPLTKEQEAMCERYDALYDATHQKKGGADEAGAAAED